MSRTTRVNGKWRDGKISTTCASIYTTDGKHIYYDNKNCDDHNHEIVENKRLFKRMTNRKFRRTNKINKSSRLS